MPTPTMTSGSPSGSMSLASTSIDTLEPTTTDAAVGVDQRRPVERRILDLDEHAAARDAAAPVVDLVGERDQRVGTGSSGDRELLALDGHIERRRQGLDHRDGERVAVRVAVVEQHRQRRSRRCGAPGSRPAARRGPVVGVGCGDGDAHRGGVADGVEHVAPRGSRTSPCRRSRGPARTAAPAAPTGPTVSVTVPPRGGAGVLGDAERVALGVEVVGEHIDDHRHVDGRLGVVDAPDGRAVGGVGGEQLDHHGRTRLESARVGDRVPEPVETGVPGIGLVLDAIAVDDADRPVQRLLDRDHCNRVAVGVEVVGRHGDGDGAPGTRRHLVVDGHRRVVDPVVVGFGRSWRPRPGCPRRPHRPRTSPPRGPRHPRPATGSCRHPCRRR